jgi:hypothetical protein
VIVIYNVFPVNARVKKRNVDILLANYVLVGNATKNASVMLYDVSCHGCAFLADELT